MQAEFNRLLEYKDIYVLDIPDEFQFMDPDLVEEIETKVAHTLSLED